MLTPEDIKAQEESCQSGRCRLPNGCTLYWKRNEAGGRTYFSDEVGGGVMVWDTCLCDESSVLAAMVKERELEYFENWRNVDKAKLKGSDDV